MKNIVIHEKVDNGKTLLLVANNIRVLYDEKEVQFINKKYRKTVISNHKKQIIAFKISKQNPIPLYSKVESDELVSYFYWDIDKQGIHIIISKIEPFADIKLYRSMHVSNLEAFSDEKHLRQAKEILKDAMCISDITRHLDMSFCNIFYCDYCEHEIQVNYTNKDEIIVKCDFCEATYEIKFEPTIKAIVRQNKDYIN